MLGGGNAFGQLGIGSLADQTTPTAVALGSGRTALQIASGMGYNEDHTCALLDDGSVKCWGGNNSGQLGLGDMTDTTNDTNSAHRAPSAIVNLGSGRTATELAVGDDHTCALLDNGSLVCWGQNGQGELGIGSTTNGTTPATVSLGAGFTPVHIAASYYSTCAWTSAGAAKCWGNNTNGQLGQGNTTPIGDGGSGLSVAFASVISFGGGLVSQVSPADYSTCARLSTGSVKCWGMNNDGQLGLGNMTAIQAPGSAVDFGGGRTATQIATGGAHTCALLDNNSMRCWGANDNGQLGQNNTDHVGDGTGPAVSAISAIAF